MKGYLFAGQGAQYVGMGKDLYESFSASRQVFEKADEILGLPISRLCFEGPQEELTRTKNCQPAILTMTVAAWKAFLSSASPRLTRDSFVSGLSLGEYSALVAAEALTFEDAVYLIRKRGEFMEEAALKRPGKMLSLIGMDNDALKQLCMDTSCQIANLNCPGQVVISGSLEEIEKAKGLAESRGAKKAILLEVSGAFHSSYMKEASERLALELDKVKISEPKMTFVSNVTAKPVESAQDIKINLIKQVYSSVLWEDSMNHILSGGVMDFIEFGPGKVLKGLMRRINSNAQVINVEKKQDIESLANTAGSN